MEYSNAATNIEYGPNFDTPYLTLMAELWGVCCEEFRENTIAS